MFFMDKKNIINKLLPMGLLLAASVAIGVTGATVLHTLKLENPIKTPTVEGEIKEENLGIETKQVSFTNTGEADVFIRAAISQTWTYEEDGKKTILPNTIYYETDNKLVHVAVPYGNVDKFTADSIQKNGNGTSDWIYNADDGWYYYNKVLKTSATTTNLVENVKFDLVTNNKLTDQRYKKAGYQLHCVMEVVQASDNADVSKEAVKKLFDKDLAIPENWNKDTYIISWPIK